MFKLRSEDRCLPLAYHTYNYPTITTYIERTCTIFPVALLLTDAIGFDIIYHRLSSSTQGCTMNPMITALNMVLERFIGKASAQRRRRAQTLVCICSFLHQF
jgi:hypothetical protein